MNSIVSLFYTAIYLLHSFTKIAGRFGRIEKTEELCGRKILASAVIAALLFPGVFVGPPNSLFATRILGETVSTSSPPSPFLISGSESWVTRLTDFRSTITASLLALALPDTETGNDEPEMVKSEPAAPPPPSAYDLGIARLSPKNATGETNLYSQNFSWGNNLVRLPGRTGLDVSLGISYNSLVWVKSGSDIVFDPDSNNISPGFQFGFPIIEPVYYDSGKSKWTYLMVEPSGARVEFRETAADYTYESVDSTYSQLVTTGAGDPDDNVAGISIVLTKTDGTQMSYSWKVDGFKCTQIKDRNGNYISNSYNATTGVLETVTDTLSRVLTISYNGDNQPTTITQTWKDTNGSGSNVTYTWATLAYTTATVSTSFSGLTVVGPANSSTVKVLEKITYPDSSFTKFEYNGYIQVKKVSNIGADSTSHVLNYVSTNLDSPSSGQTDCPRFTETRTKTENFNVVSGSPAEVVVTNTLTTGATYSLPDSISGSATRIDVAMTGHPDGLYSRIYVGASGYKEGLTLATEDCTGSNCATRLRWTWSEWTQDNTGLSYILNPRVVETRVGDGTNTQRTTVGYGSNGYGLPELIKVYDTDLSTVLKTQTMAYNLGSTYTNRRIIGLPAEFNLWQGLDVYGTLMSKVTYTYDEGNLTGSDPVQNISPVQHDGTNYSSSFVAGRGLLTKTTRWDATAPTTSGSAVSSTAKYNTAGSLVSRTSPLSNSIKISYTDNFNSSPGVSTFAYPTTLTDPAGNSSTVKYRYDLGTNIEATGPVPSGQSYGKTSKRLFDSLGRLDRQSIYVNTTEKSYTRYTYPTNGIQTQSYAALIDTNSSGGPDSSDEVYSESWFDGAGRVRQSRTEHPGSSGGWSSTLIDYDILGRVFRTSVPTETNSSYTATGDDSSRGWIWNYQYYDWKGRVIRTVPSDSTGSDGKDTLISYTGCGCAGGQVTTISGPVTTAVDVGGTTQTTKRRTQKSYEDILGRLYKTEIWDLDGGGGSPYSTVKTTFNGRDQATLIREYSGSDSSSTYQDTTMSYDGHGRLYQSHKPEQRDGSTLKYTTYNYNSDDSISSATDGRGVVTSYTYNSRGLPTNIAWNVGSTGVTDPTDVTFTYDNAGNRTAMTDALGSMSYSYNPLSQMTDETRDFTDSLADSPIAGGQFKLEYTYEIGGQLKSYKDPWSKELIYTHDKIGRLNSLTGTSFGGISTYADNPGYRAWGGLKHLDYSDSEINLTYNHRLQPASYSLNSFSYPSIKTFDKTYEYYPDGRLKLADENSSLYGFDKYDRSFTDDFAGRIVTAKSGVEAHGGTETDLSMLPYRQSYTHDAFGHMTGRSSTLWDYTTGNWDFAYTFTNNRVDYSGYDSDGRQTIDPRTDDDGDPIYYVYNGAGRLEKTWRYYDPYETLIMQDGQGVEVKRSQRVWDTEEEEWGTWETAYFINSTVLGRLVSEATSTGKKKYTYVIGAGTTVARQAVSSSNVESVDSQFTDASGLSSVGFRAEELDGLGNNVGKHAVLTPPVRSGNALSPVQGVTFDDMTIGDCEMDGIIVPCSMASRGLSSGAAIPSDLQRYQHSRGFSFEDTGLGTFRANIPGYYFSTPNAPDLPDGTVRIGSDGYQPPRSELYVVNDDWVLVPIPADITTRIETVLKDGDCNSFIKNLIAKAGEIANNDRTAYNKKFPHALLPPIVPDAVDGFGLLAGLKGNFIFESLSLDGRNIATVSGSIKGGDAAVILPKRYYKPSEIKKGDDARAYWQSTFVGIAIHELVHLAGKGYWADQDLARAAKALGEDVGEVEEGNSYDAEKILYYSGKWNGALAKHCKGVQK